MTIARVVAVAVLCLSSVGVVAGQSAKESAAVEKQITATLNQMYEAEKRKDLKFIFSHLAEDFAEVAGDGKIYHRSDIEAGWNDVVLNSYELLDCVFKLMTHDSAYMSCEMELDALYKSQPFPGRFRVTYFWTRQNNDWLLRFEQGTIIPEPAKSK
jgi:ketosteroid isomerase-like protein